MSAKTLGKRANTRIAVFLLLCLIAAPPPVRAQASGNNAGVLPQAEVDRLIKSFTSKEAQISSGAKRILL